MGEAQTEELMHTFQALIKVVFLDVGLAIDSYIAHRDDLIADLRDYGAAFANLPYGTMVATSDLKVVFANRAFENLFGFAPSSLRGCPLSNVMDVSHISALIDAAMRQQSARDAGGAPHHNPLAVPVSITAPHRPRPKTATSSACCWCLKTCANKRSSRATCSTPRRWPTSAPGRRISTVPSPSPQAARLLAGP